MKKRKKKYHKIHHILGVTSMGITLCLAFAYIFFDVSFFTTPAHAQIDSIYQYNQESMQSNGQSQTSKYTEEKIINKFIQIINDSKTRYETDFDFTTDSSLQKYISAAKPLNNITYIPADLETIEIKNSTHISSQLKNPELRSPARIAFEKLAQDFYTEFDKKLILKSAYRSYTSQKRLIDNGCSLKQCAKPGTSEHQLGLAVDLQVEHNNGTVFKLNNKNNKYYKWLDANAHRYGFHNTYKNGLHTDSEIKMEEHRHRRYCSIPVATFLYEQNLTLGEYFNQLTN